jgi:hypothetical protein
MNELRCNDDNTKITQIIGLEAKALGVEYEELMTAESLSEAQEARIAEILDLAITHEEVDFWVSHSTNSQAMEAGLLCETAQNDFENQKTMLREHLGEADIPTIRGRAAMSVEAQLKAQLRQEKMSRLLAAANNTKTNDQNLNS